jgi:hypothetical protein
MCGHVDGVYTHRDRSPAVEVGRLAIETADLLTSKGGSVRKLLDAVAGQMARQNSGQVLDKFLSNPADDAGRTMLLTELVRQFRDDADFRHDVLSLVQSLTGGAPPKATVVTATHDSVAIGHAQGDVNVWTRRVTIGGFSIPLGAVIIGGAIVMAFGGFFIANTGGSGSLSGSSTCREWLAADSATQATVLKKLYLDAGKTEHAADPFIVQNGQYFCGPRPDTTLGKLVESRR